MRVSRICEIKHDVDMLHDESCWQEYRIFVELCRKMLPKSAGCISQRLEDEEKMPYTLFLNSADSSNLAEGNPALIHLLFN